MTATVELETELLVSRESELEEISALLSDPDCRLLTLTGPDGSGKTRLAVAVAAGEREKRAYPDGVCFVSLVSLANATFLASAIAGTLGFPLQGLQHPARQLLD